MDNLYSKAKDSMNKSLEHLKTNFLSVNTGRATPDLLNTVRVEFYGSIMPLNQVSTLRRATQGVRLINLKEDQKVATVAIVEKEESTENNEENTNNSQES
jgi:ribosome recycling factor